MTLARATADNGSIGQNLIINGNFDIWQRGTNFPVALSYTADRWLTAGASTDSQINTAPPGADDTNYVINLATAGQVPELFQGIELGKAGNTAPFIRNTDYTISFWVWTDIAQDILVDIRYAHTAAGVGSVAIIPPTIAGSVGLSTWTKFEFTFNTGSVVPTSGNKCVMVLLKGGVAVTGNTKFARVKLEKGSSATEFTSAGGSKGAELELCQRYFWNLGGTDNYHGMGYYYTSASAYFAIPFPNPMRIPPSVIWGSGPSAWGFYTNSTGDIFDTFSGSAPTEEFAMLWASSGISGVSGASGGLYGVTADANILFDAEL